MQVNIKHVLDNYDLYTDDDIHAAIRVLAEQVVQNEQQRRAGQPVDRGPEWMGEATIEARGSVPLAAVRNALRQQEANIRAEYADTPAARWHMTDEQPGWND